MTEQPLIDTYQLYIDGQALRLGYNVFPGYMFLARGLTARLDR